MGNIMRLDDVGQTGEKTNCGGSVRGLILLNTE